jgi:hypothetical protein
MNEKLYTLFCRLICDQHELACIVSFCPSVSPYEIKCATCNKSVFCSDAIFRESFDFNMKEVNDLLVS